MPKDTLVRNSTVTLILMCSALFMIVLDFSIVNVALPSIQRELKLSTADLQWPVTAYALVFGGFMLLGGRAADYFGGQRVFLSGLGLFTLASLAGGLAPNAGVLVAARSFQGLGAAFLAPTVFSLITTHYSEGLERNKALGWLSAMAAAGFSSGVVLGGLLTTAFGWRAVMIVNVPLGLGLGILTPFFLPRVRAAKKTPGIDWPGGWLITGSLLAFIYAITRIESGNWLSGQVLAAGLAASLLLVAFAWAEGRAAHPLIPRRFFQMRLLVSSNLALAFASAALVPVVFVITLYTQNVLGYSPWRAGLTLLPQALLVALASGPVSRLTSHGGIKWGMLAGALILGTGVGLLSPLPEHGRYLSDILPGTVLLGLGLAFTNVTTSIAATTDVKNEDQGIAGGLLNTARQIGAALGLASIIAVANYHLPVLSAPSPAWLAGFRLALRVDMGISFLSLFFIWLAIPGRVGAQARTLKDCEPGALRALECQPADL